MLVDALVADRAGAVFHQPAADLIGAPLLLRQFFLDQFYEIWLHLAWRTRGCFSFLRRLLLRLFEAIAPRAGVAIQLALDRRAMNAKLAPYGGLREAALHEGVTLATFFVGQTVIAFGHMSSVRCGVPREDSPHLAVTRHAQHGKVWQGKRTASRVLATFASPPATCALAPALFPSPYAPPCRLCIAVALRS